MRKRKNNFLERLKQPQAAAAETKRKQDSEIPEEERARRHSEPWSCPLRAVEQAQSPALLEVEGNYMSDVPLEELGLKKAWPKLAELQQEIADLTRRHQEAQTEVHNLEAKLEAAPQADLDREAKAIREGKQPPKAKHEPQIQEKLKAAQRTQAVYARALQEAQSDLGAFRAKHGAALYKAVLEARNEIARDLAKHAQAAAAGFGRWSDLAYTLRNLAPPPDYEAAENAPMARSSTHIIGMIHATQSAGPARGEVESVLSYLASPAPNEEGESSAA